MAVTTDQKREFGARVRVLRTALGMSMPDLVVVLAEHGEEFSHQALSAWERGEYAPSQPETVRALEQIFGVDGELLDLLGMVAGPTLNERVEGLERRVAALEAASPGPSRPRRR